MMQRAEIKKQDESTIQTIEIKKIKKNNYESEKISIESKVKLNGSIIELKDAKGQAHRYRFINSQTQVEELKSLVSQNPFYELQMEKVLTEGKTILLGAGSTSKTKWVEEIDGEGNPISNKKLVMRVTPVYGSTLKEAQEAAERFIKHQQSVADPDDCSLYGFRSSKNKKQPEFKKIVIQNKPFSISKKVDNDTLFLFITNDKMWANWHEENEPRIAIIKDQEAIRNANLMIGYQKIKEINNLFVIHKDLIGIVMDECCPVKVSNELCCCKVYMVMPYLGKNLQATISKLVTLDQPERLKQGIELGTKIAQTINWFHKRGLSHNDIEANILISNDGNFINEKTKVSLIDRDSAKFLGIESSTSRDIKDTGRVLQKLMGQICPSLDGLSGDALFVYNEIKKCNHKLSEVIDLRSALDDLIIKYQYLLKILLPAQMEKIMTNILSPEPNQNVSALLDDFFMYANRISDQSNIEEKNKPSIQEKIFGLIKNKEQLNNEINLLTSSIMKFPFWSEHFYLKAIREAKKIKANEINLLIRDMLYSILHKERILSSTTQKIEVEQNLFSSISSSFK